MPERGGSGACPNFLEHFQFMGVLGLPKFVVPFLPKVLDFLSVLVYFFNFNGHSLQLEIVSDDIAHRIYHHWTNAKSAPN